MVNNLGNTKNVILLFACNSPENDSSISESFQFF